MYKPNFCAACGEQVVRAKWHLWTSRRFCQTCAPRFRKERIVAPLIPAVIVFGTGLAAGRLAHNSSNAPPPLVVERNNNHLIKETREASPPVVTSKETVSSVEAEQKSNASSNSNSEFAKARHGAAGERLTDPNEIVSICGARTQKGTPCSRRVRGTGRCWQHKGLPAIIPLEKRVVTG